MKLNHLNMTVADPGVAATFLARYCGMRMVDDSNKNFIFMTDDNGMVFALMKGKDATYPASFHIGFIQPSASRVDEINAMMRADGVEVDLPRQLHAWTFYAKIPGGFMVEILA